MSSGEFLVHGPSYTRSPDGICFHGGGWAPYSAQIINPCNGGIAKRSRMLSANCVGDGDAGAAVFIAAVIFLRVLADTDSFLFLCRISQRVTVYAKRIPPVTVALLSENPRAFCGEAYCAYHCHGNDAIPMRQCHRRCIGHYYQ